jgi:archaellum component FlaC
LAGSDLSSFKMDKNTIRNLEHELSAFEKKLGMLVNVKEKLSWSLSEAQRENAELRSENQRLREEAKEIKKKYTSLEKDFNKSKSFAKIVTSKLTPTSGIAELKESVERYIQEIDKCIAMLENTL